MSKSFANDFMNEFVELELPKEISDRFNVLERYAQNEYGETYLLSKKNGGDKFVLKCYKKTDAICTVHEAELLSGLEHKGLPHFETEIENEDTLFILREHIEGMTLDHYIEEHPTDEMQAVNIIMKLCDILTYLHSQTAPIIHRDIKPSNIIVNPHDNQVTLIDFGISRKYDQEADTDTAFFGTEKFAPPEQYGFAQTDCRADVYALGVVLRYMLTGTTDKKTSLKDKSLEGIAAKCAAFSPDDRYQSAAALKKSLVKYKGRVKQKILLATTSIVIACLMFSAGFVIGRHTDFLQYQTNDMVFTEPLIEKAVRLTLGKEKGEISRDELKSISEIYIVGEEAAATKAEWEQLCAEFFPNDKPFGTLKSLNDINALENLIELHIMAQPLSDLSPLSSNSWLKLVEIKHSDISDVSPLVNVPRLEILEIFDSKITDCTSFKDMKMLRVLGIGKSPIDSLSAFTEMPNIDSLNIHGALITSFEGIENFPNLQYLHIKELKIHDLSPLDRLQYLEEITISPDMEQYLNTFSGENVNVVIN